MTDRRWAVYHDGALLRYTKVRATSPAEAAAKVRARRPGRAPQIRTVIPLGTNPNRAATRARSRAARWVRRQRPAATWALVAALIALAAAAHPIALPAGAWAGWAAHRRYQRTRSRWARRTRWLRGSRRR